MTQVLGIFGKHPTPGEVKTRLAAATSPAWAAQVAGAFLRVTLDRFAEVGDRRVLAFAPLSAADYFTSLVAARFDLEPQTNGDLGQRMARFFGRHLQPASHHVVLIGTDSPTLPLEFVASAFDLLRDHDVVLGPATDGGYYLIGCTGHLPPIFTGIDWGAATVLAATIQKLPPDYRLGLLPPWYDVDTLDDWQMLRGHLEVMRQAAMEVKAFESLLKLEDASSQVV